MPPEQQSHQRRLAGAGAAHDRHVLAGRDPAVDRIEQHVAAGAHGGLAQLDGDAPGGPQGGPRGLSLACGGRLDQWAILRQIFVRVQGLQQPQQQIALQAGVPHDLHDVASQHWQLQRPPHEQKCECGVGAGSHVARQQDCRERHSRDALHSIERDAGSYGPHSRACPVRQQPFVLGAHRGRRAMGAHRGQAEQGVEIEPLEGPVVRTRTQIALRQMTRARQRHEEREQHSGSGEPCVRRIEPGNRCPCRAECGHRREKMACEGRHETDLVRGVGALGHVRDRAAAEVAVRKARQLVEQRHAQPHFHAAPQAQQAQRDAQLEQQQHQDKAREGADRRQPLSRHAQPAAHVQCPAQQEHLEHDHRSGDRTREQHGGDGRATVAPDQLP